MEEPATNPDNDQKRLEQIGQHRFQGSSTRIYVIAFTAMALFLVAPAAWLVLQTFSADATLARRLLLLSMAAFLLALPGRVAWVVLRRRRRTGHWSLRLSHEERLQLAAKWGRPIRPWVTNLTMLVSILVAATWIFITWKRPHEILNWINAALWVCILAQDLRSRNRQSKPSLPKP